MIKKISLSLVLLLAVFNLNAQLKEGVITYSMDYASDNEQIAPMLEQMVGTMKIYTKGNKTRVENSSMMVGMMVAVSDIDKKESIVLMDNPMMGKKYAKVPADKFDQVSEMNQVVKDAKTFKKTDEHKDILGYDCVKYEITNEQGDYVLWVTDEIKAKQPLFDGKLTGTALHTTAVVNAQGMVMSISIKATKIEKIKIDDSKFDMSIPEGYTEFEQDLFQ